MSTEPAYFAGLRKIIGGPGPRPPSFAQMLARMSAGHFRVLNLAREGHPLPNDVHCGTLHRWSALDNHGKLTSRGERLLADYATKFPNAEWQ